MSKSVNSGRDRTVTRCSVVTASPAATLYQKPFCTKWSGTRTSHSASPTGPHQAAVIDRPVEVGLSHGLGGPRPHRGPDGRVNVVALLGLDVADDAVLGVVDGLLHPDGGVQRVDAAAERADDGEVRGGE